MKFVKTTVSSKTFGVDKEFTTVTHYFQEELMSMNIFDSLLAVDVTRKSAIQL